MKKIVENFAALLKVKTIVTLAIVAVFVILALTEAISSEQVMYIVTTVVA